MGKLFRLFFTHTGTLAFLALCASCIFGMRECIQHCREGRRADEAARVELGCMDVDCDANGTDTYLCRCQGPYAGFRVVACDLEGWNVPGRQPACHTLDDMGGNPWH